MVTSHIKNLRSVLLTEIFQAKNSIDIAIAWFTDSEVLSALVGKLKEKVAVRIIISNAHQNFTESYSLDFNVFKSHGGIIYIVQNEFLHHKFTVIDNKILVTGSANYTYSGFFKNAENLMVFKEEPENINMFREEFERLLKFFPKAETGLVLSPFVEFLRSQLDLYNKLIFNIDEEILTIIQKIDEYEIRYRIEFSDILEKIIWLKKIIADYEVKLTKQEKYKTSAKVASEQWENFKFNKIEDQKSIEKIDDSDLQTKLKALYREGSRLCHPDQLTDEEKEEGAKYFQLLNSAYKAHDLDKLSAVVTELKKGLAFGNTRWQHISEIDQLEMLVEELKFKWANKINEAEKLRNNEKYILSNDSKLLTDHFQLQEKLLQDILKSLTNQAKKYSII